MAAERRHEAGFGSIFSIPRIRDAGGNAHRPLTGRAAYVTPRVASPRWCSVHRAPLGHTPLPPRRRSGNDPLCPEEVVVIGKLNTVLRGSGACTYAAAERVFLHCKRPSTASRDAPAPAAPAHRHGPPQYPLLAKRRTASPDQRPAAPQRTTSPPAAESPAGKAASSCQHLTKCPPHGAARCRGDRG